MGWSERRYLRKWLSIGLVNECVVRGCVRVEEAAGRLLWNCGLRRVEERQGRN